MDIKLPNDLGLGLKIGSNFAINESLKIGIAVSYTQTLSRFKVEDTVSGANGTISNCIFIRGRQKRIWCIF